MEYRFTFKDNYFLSVLFNFLFLLFFFCFYFYYPIDVDGRGFNITSVDFLELSDPEERWLLESLFEGVNGEINDIVISGDDIFVGGSFTHAGDLEVNNIARYNRVENTWYALGEGVDRSVYALYLHEDELYVGGNFSTVNGESSGQRYIVKYNILTNSWNSIFGASDSIRAIEKVGDYLYLSDLRSRVDRYNLIEGQFETLEPFVANVGYGISLKAHGEYLYVAGDFRFVRYNDTWVPGKALVRYDTVNEEVDFYLESNQGENWRGLANISQILLADEEIYISGVFSETLNLTGVARIDVINQTIENLDDNISGAVYTLLWIGDELFAGGEFLVEGTEIKNLARFDLNNETWDTVGGNAEERVNVLVQNGNEIFAAGNFLSIGEESVNRLAWYNLTDNFWSGTAFPGNGIEKTVLAVETSGSDIFIGGEFKNADGRPANHIVRYNTESDTWHPLGEGVDGTVHAIKVEDNQVFVGGSFRNAGGITANRVARFDLGSETWHSLGEGVNDIVYALGLHDSDLFAGGRFTENIARFDLNSESWHTLGGGVDGWVHAITVHEDQLFVGGRFNTAGGLSSEKIARFDLIFETWQPLYPDIETSARIYALKVVNDDLYAGGIIRSAGHILRYHLPNETWHTLDEGFSGIVQTIETAHGDLYVGGNIYGDVDHILRFDIKEQTWHPLAEGVNGGVYGITQMNQDLYVGGSFTQTGNLSAARFAHYGTAPRILEKLPNPNQTDVAVDEPLYFKFDRNSGLFNPGGISLKDEELTEVNTIISRSGSLVEINHPGLKHSKNYNLEINPGTLISNSGVENLPDSWFFSTMQENTPVVVEKIPSNGQTDISLDQVIKITFDREITEIDTSPVSITSNGGNSVSIESITISGTELEISHSGFSYETSYTISIPDGVVESNEGVENLEDTWSFTTIPSPFAGGSGTEMNPFQVSNAEELNKVRYYLDSYFILVSDIDLGIYPWNDEEGWEPIGTAIPQSSAAFRGSFNGDGYAINNLYINREEQDFIGLFGSVFEAELKNLRLQDVNIKGGSNVGALTGSASGNENNVQISKIIVTGELTAGHEHDLGFFIGGTAVGGLAGEAFGAEIYDSHTTVDIYAKGVRIGGLIGNVQENTLIEKSSSNGNIVTHQSSAGGLVGQMNAGYGSNESRISQSYSTVNVQTIGDDQGRLGGLVGSVMGENARIENSYSTGDVDGGDNTNSSFPGVGGLVGQILDEYPVIENSYSVGTVVSEHEDGGLIGRNALEDGSNVINSYWDINNSGLTVSDGGEGLTSVEMKTSVTFDNWNFSDVWAIKEGLEISYPYLRENEQDPVPGYIELFTSGDGSQANPYLIESGEHLYYIRYKPDAHFRQVQDIVFQQSDFEPGGSFYHDGAGWEPIGNELTSFTGTYDGDGYRIENLWIDRPEEDRVGLFGFSENSSFENLNLESVNVVGDSIVGGLIAEAVNVELNNVEVSGQVTARSFVGGLAGSIDNSNVKHAHAHVDVFSTSTTEEGTSHAGGLIGRVSDESVIELSSASGNVVIHSRYGGGLIGYLRAGSEVKQSFATGDVMVNDSDQGIAGGLVGGMHHDNTRIENSYALGEVSAGLNNHDIFRGIGGLVGRIQGENAVVYSSYSSGSVNAENNIGGLIGNNVDGSGANVINSFWDVEASGVAESAGGEGRTTIQMKVAGTFGDWDFSEVWAIKEGLEASYPYLQENEQDLVPGYIELFTSGDGSQANPYLIESGEHLHNIRYKPDAYFRQVQDIVFQPSDFEPGGAFYNDGKGWEPIGNADVPFSGTYDGAGFKILNLKINREGESNVGLFGYGRNANLIDTHLEGIDIKGEENVGGIIGRLESDEPGTATITSSSAEGTVDGKASVGGIAGVVTGDVTVLNSHASVNVTSTASAAGGWTNAGGLVGRAEEGFTIQNSSASGNVVSEGRMAGGLVGGFRNGGLISQSFATGSVSIINVNNQGEIGGLVGSIRGEDTRIENSYALGDVTADQSEVGSFSGAGGLVGRIRDEGPVIVNSYATGSVSSTNDFGGLIGTNDGDGSGLNVTNSFWNVETSGVAESAGGTGNSSFQMRTQTTFENWDYADVWTMRKGAQISYPYLIQNEQDPVPGYLEIYSDGEGTESDPFLVENKEHLDQVRYNPDSYFLQTNDIIFNPEDFEEGGVFYHSGNGWEPIGTENKPFIGNYDGNQYRIENIRINRPNEDNIGLFGWIGIGGTVENLHLGDIDITGDSYVGTLVGNNQGSIYRVSANGTVTGTSRVGGLAGLNEGNENGGRIIYSYSMTTVTGNGNWIGGLVGYHGDGGLIQDAFARGDVIQNSSSGQRRTGGLAGYSSGQIKRTYATGEVAEGSSGGQFNGLIAENDDSDIVNSFFDRETTGQNNSHGGTGLTTEEMLDSDTYRNEGWDILSEFESGDENVWIIIDNKNDGYPYLGWEYDYQEINFEEFVAKEYGDSEFDAIVSSDSGLEINLISLNEDVATVSGLSITIKGVGSAEIVATQSGNEDYNPAPAVSQTLVIEPRLITVINAEAESREYNGTEIIFITGAELDGVLENDNVVLENSDSGVAEQISVGSDIPVSTSMNLSGADSDNYYIEQPELTVNITPRLLTLSNFSVDDKEYDGTVEVFGESFEDNRINEDEIEFTYDVVFEDKNVGDNKTVLFSNINITGKDAANYELNSDLGSATASITPRELVIQVIEEQFKIYGDDDPEFTVTIDNFVEGEDEEILEGSLSREIGEDTGNYEIGIGDLTAGDNYEILFTGEEFSIIPRTLEIHVDSNLWKFIDEEDPVLTYVAEGFAFDDDESILTGSLTREEGEEAGKYEILIGDLDAGDNYEIEFYSEEFSILLLLLMPLEFIPSPNESGVALDAVISIEFYEPIEIISPNDIRLLEKDGQQVEIELEVNGNLLELKHNGLEPYKNYQVEIGADALQNFVGISNEDLKWSFTSIMSVPEVIEFYPEDNSRGIKKDTEVVVEFNHPIVEVDLTGIKLFNVDNGNEKSIEIEIADHELKIFYDGFEYGKEYQVVVGAGSVENTDGIKNEEHSWNFTIIMSVPKPVTFAPLPDQDEVEVDVKISIEFNQPIEIVTADEIKLYDNDEESIEIQLLTEDNRLILNHNGLEYFQTYQVQVAEGALQNEDGVGNDEMVWEFSTMMILPDIVELLNPDDGVGTVPLQPDLQWSISQHVEYYHLQISTDESFQDLLFNKNDINGNEKSVEEALDTYTEYFWRVRALNQAGSSDWSEIGSFTTIASTPKLMFPGNGSEHISIAPMLEWTSDYDTQFRVQLASNEQFNEVITDSTLSDIFLQVTGLNEDYTYYWRVKVNSESTTSNWSDTKSFNTRPSPAVNDDQEQVTGVIDFGESSGSGNVTLSQLDYRLIGMPGKESQSLTDFFNGEYGNQWKAFLDNGSDSEYFEEFNPSDQRFRFSPGKGFWVLSTEILEIDFKISSVEINELDAYKIPLHSGWNIISNPFRGEVKIDDIEELNGISLDIYGYNQRFIQAETLYPLEGYYIYNDPDNHLEWLEIPYSGMDQRRSNRSADKSYQAKSVAPSKKGVMNLSAGFEKGHEFNVELVYGVSEENTGNYLRYYPSLEMSKRGMVLTDEAIQRGGLKRGVSVYNAEGNKYQVQLKGTVGDSFSWYSELKNLGDQARIMIVNPVTNQNWLLEDGESIEAILSEPTATYDLYVGDESYLLELQKSMQPTEFTLMQNYPNPFNPITNIRYAIPKDEFVRLEIYDVIGRRVMVLQNGFQEAGWHNVQFNASRFASGIYFYRIQIGHEMRVKQMTLIK